MTILNDPPPALEADIQRAARLHRDGRPDQAATLYRAILKTAPGDSAAMHNLGVVLAGQGETAAALALFDQAIGVRPDYTHAHVNRGGALQSLGRLEDAADSYGRALSLQADLYPIHLRRALVLLALGRRAGALEHLSTTHALRSDERSTGRTSRLKLAHDQAQFDYLAANGIESGRFAALGALYGEAVRHIPWPDDGAAAIDLPDPWRGRLAESHNRPLHRVDAPEMAGPALSPELDPVAVAAAYVEDAPGIALIGQLLSPEALEGLRRFLLGSTIWYDFSHIGGYLACYLEDGLACPLLLQIADELRAALPGILGPHPLRQAWAFKCLSGEGGIDLHADSGAVSVNFWVTPEDSNLVQPDGGLVIYRAAPPAGWTLADYHRDIGRIRQHLAENDAGAVTAPYGANRAVLFRSDLFHQSGLVRFRPGYQNHRINITLLFGEPNV